MVDVKTIHIDDYVYELPEEKIAKFPLEKRDESKLLVYENGAITDTQFKYLDGFLPAQSVLVFNNTRVIHARIIFQKSTGSNIEIFCIEPQSHSDYQLALLSRKQSVWKCMIGNAKRWKNEVLEKEILTPNGSVVLRAEKGTNHAELFDIQFSWNNDSLCFAEVLDLAGILPLPPYLNRKADVTDEERYQTIYAKQQGSVAAPTAGLHFTDDVFAKLSQKNIQTHAVTLHVGAGTFKPVKALQLQEHNMHEETFYVEKATIKNLINAINNYQKIVAVGTTSTRTLESLYWWGVKILNKHNAKNVYIAQWDAYELVAKTVSPLEALQAVYDSLELNEEEVLQGSTQIIIAPGYEFKIVSGLITNFHQPQNTLILLIAAFVGNKWREIYEYALKNNYRFLSYGDSSLLWQTHG